ncbi:MAG: hypothetical protein IT528_00195 [Nitrosomonas sp.]|nr:hypothetical protein [Nitrosomonas sp.]
MAQLGYLANCHRNTIWSGVGVALISLIAWIFFGQALDTPAVIGILLIVAGVVVLSVFSRTVSH